MEHGTDQPGQGVVSGGVLINSKSMPPITEPERVKIIMSRGGDRERYFFLSFGEVTSPYRNIFHQLPEQRLRIVPEYLGERVRTGIPAARSASPTLAAKTAKAIFRVAPPKWPRTFSQTAFRSVANKFTVW